MSVQNSLAVQYSVGYSGMAWDCELWLSAASCQQMAVCLVPDMFIAVVIVVKWVSYRNDKNRNCAQIITHITGHHLYSISEPIFGPSPPYISSYTRHFIVYGWWLVMFVDAHDILKL